MSAVQVASHPSAFEGYTRAGWKLCPVASGTKGPNTPGWNLLTRAITDASAIPPGHGAGLLHAFSGTMALDVDDWAAAAMLLAERGIDLQALMDDQDAVQIDSGSPGHGKLIYAMPLGAVLPSKRLMHNGKVALELRCGTSTGTDKSVQDVLPPSAHPSGTTYQWAGRGRWDRLPTLPVALLEYWEELVAGDGERTLTVPGEINASWDEIRAALMTINPSCPREHWLRAAMGLNAAAVALGQPDVGLSLFNDWSAGSAEKYAGMNDVLAVWNSIKADHPNGVAIGTLFHIAKEYGWKRPTPDVSALFTNMAPVTPEDILAGMIQAPPGLDMDLLPPVLRQRANEVADGIGCDPLVPAWAGLGCVSAAADARIRLELVPGFQVPPVTWLMVIGSPADKKTPGMKPMLSVLAEIERADVPRYRSDLLKWEGLEVLHAAQKKAFLQDVGNMLNRGDIDGPAVGDLPPSPVPLRLTVSDVTSQKLIRHVGDRPYGTLCVLDEMSSWMAKLTGTTSGEDRSTWVQGYEANPYHLDRVGTGSMTAENFAVSILGAVQPKIFRKHTPALAMDGTLQRFVPAILRGNTNHVGNPVPDWMTSAATWDQAVRTAHGASLERYTLSPAARAAFREFQIWADATRKRERFLRAPDAFLTALGKVEGTCGRLALLFHLIEAPSVPVVEADTMARVIAMVQGYVVPAMRYAYGEVAGLTEESLEFWVTQFIAQVAHEPKITLAEIRRSARRQVEGMPAIEVDEIIRSTMSSLEAKNWVICTADKGRHVEYAINPAIAETFADYRRQVIEAKQATRDVIQGKLNHTGAIVPPVRGSQSL